MIVAVVDELGGREESFVFCVYAADEEVIGWKRSLSMDLVAVPLSTELGLNSRVLLPRII